MGREEKGAAATRGQLSAKQLLFQQQGLKLCVVVSGAFDPIHGWWGESLAAA